MFIPPKKETINNIPLDAGHFLRNEIDSTDFKKENLITKSTKIDFYKKKNMHKKPESDETIRLSDEISAFKPGKKAQLAAKKISEKYKNIRKANALKAKNNKDTRTLQQLKDDDFIALESDEDTKKITDVRKNQKELQNIETKSQIKKGAANKNKTITANKISKKHKNMKKSKKTFLVNEEDLDIIKYTENDQEIDDFSSDEDLFAGESILNAINKNLKKNKKMQ